MRFYFRGSPYNVVFKKLKLDYGTCNIEPPRVITISSSIKKPELLMDTMIHEALHACYPDLEEEAINTAATDIAEFLWKMGFRRVAEGKAKKKKNTKNNKKVKK